MSDDRLPALRADVIDKTNETSIVSLAPSVLVKAIEAIPKEFWEMSEDELAGIFRKGRKGYTKETEIEERLRISIWREYDRCVERGIPLNLHSICSGICQVPFFTRFISGNSARLAYLLSPPPDFVTTMTELMQLSHQQMRDILQLPHVDDKGRLDARAAEVKLKIMEAVTMRAKGAVAHRIESRNLNVNVETNKPAPTGLEELDTPEKIQQRLAELRGETTSTEESVIDVTPKAQT